MLSVGGRRWHRDQAKAMLKLFNPSPDFIKMEAPKLPDKACCLDLRGNEFLEYLRVHDEKIAKQAFLDGYVKCCEERGENLAVWKALKAWRKR